jgi:hypothetical protein
VRGVSPRPPLNQMAFFDSVKNINLTEREGLCHGLRARHRVSSSPPGLSRGLTWCSTPDIHKDDDAWHTY